MILDIKVYFQPAPITFGGMSQVPGSLIWGVITKNVCVSWWIDIIILYFPMSSSAPGEYQALSVCLSVHSG